MGGWVAKAGRFESKLRFSAEPGLLLILTLMSLGGAEERSGRRKPAQRCLSAASSLRPAWREHRRESRVSGKPTPADDFLLTF